MSRYINIVPKIELLISESLLWSVDHDRSLPHVVAVGDLIASPEAALPETVTPHRTAASFNTIMLPPVYMS